MPLFGEQPQPHRVEWKITPRVRRSLTESGGFYKFRQKIASLTQELDTWEAMAANTDFEDTLAAH